MRLNYKLLSVPLLTLILPAILQALTLDQAIEIGLARSPLQEVPKIEQYRTEGQIKEAWSNALPQVDGIAGYQRTFKSLKFSPSPDNTGFASATVSQPIYTFGRIGAALDAAMETRVSNNLIAEQTGKNLQLEVLRSFWSVLLMKDVVQVRRDALSVAEGTLTRVTRLKEVGMLSEFDVLRARSQVSSLVPTLHEAENNLRLSELALKNLLGVPLDTVFTVEGNLDHFRLDIGNDTTVSAAMNRSDLEALRRGVEAYGHIYTIYKNAGLPTIGSQLKYDWQWGDDDFEFNGNNSGSGLTGAISVAIPIWTSGKNDGKAQQIRADWRKMKLDLYNAERGAELQLAQALSKYGTARLNEESAEVAVDQAVEARRIAESRLENGQLTPLDLQTSQLEETSARLLLANARFNKLVAAAEVRLVTGNSPYAGK